MTPGQLRRNKSRQGRLKLKAQESRRLEVQHVKRVARIALASVSPQLLGAIRTGVIDAAMTRPSHSATVADLDAVYAQLAGLQLRRAVAEGSVFPSTHWARCEGGWRLRELPQEMRA